MGTLGDISSFLLMYEQQSDRLKNLSKIAQLLSSRTKSETQRLWAIITGLYSIAVCLLNKQQQTRGNAG